MQYGLETEVAKHLSDNYGDRAWTVLSLAHPTGESWPLHGVRLSSQYPCQFSVSPRLTTFLVNTAPLDIEAEVRYAVRNEYAQTAIDVLARRTRLSFLNAQAALNALPRVADIMAEELGWSRSEKKKQIDDAVVFLGSMGLAPGATVAPSHHKSVFERIESVFWNPATLGVGAQKGTASIYSRAQFESGEVDTLRRAFEGRAVSVPAAQTQASGVVDEKRVQKQELPELLKGVSGYEGIPLKDFEYVFEEAGYSSRADFDFDEFVEVCRIHVPSSCLANVPYPDMCYLEGSILCTRYRRR